ncbi:hypothetical protein [Enterorhabdus sp. P55]|uniref:hypothetical protein n=1 Tax=Enterorhabdus sp. P55 TaxID=2304571 RepID=UPI00136DF175|nr:hypothetical protein [Enterorhabdus sp. P55]NBI31676.1 hypothetical protein [Enterorhabdus sp. P55]
MAIDPRKDPNATVVTTPLPSQLARKQAARAAAERAGGSGTAEAPTPPDPFRRPANEDDDGYDPYSDRPADNPLFERDPWN